MHYTLYMYLQYHFKFMISMAATACVNVAVLIELSKCPLKILIKYYLSLSKYCIYELWGLLCIV